MRKAWLLVLAAAAGCGGDGATAKTGKSGGASTGGKAQLAGSGATFPQPLFDIWFSAYSKEHADVRIDYGGGGSGAGVNHLTKETVDFAASDDGMTDEQIGKVGRGVKMIPITAGTVVLAYNLPDLKEPLKLSRSTYVGIFQGKITKWNDASIAKTNPGAKLPEQSISVVCRSDSSGTTATFTRHLSAISDEWKKSPGSAKSVKWPVGSAAKGNDQVIAQVKSSPGSIGYVEYGYAKKANLPAAWLENKAGKFVEPNAKTGAAALAKIELPATLRAFEPDPAGDDSYPIVTFSWLLAYRTYPDASKAAAIKEVVKYCLTKGQSLADENGYLPLPEAVVAKAIKAVEEIGAKAGG